MNSLVLVLVTATLFLSHNSFADTKQAEAEKVIPVEICDVSANAELSNCAFMGNAARFTKSESGSLVDNIVFYIFFEATTPRLVLVYFVSDDSQTFLNDTANGKFTRFVFDRSKIDSSERAAANAAPIRISRDELLVY